MSRYDATFLDVTGRILSYAASVLSHPSCHDTKTDEENVQSQLARLKECLPTESEFLSMVMFVESIVDTLETPSLSQTTGTAVESRLGTEGVPAIPISMEDVRTVKGYIAFLDQALAALEAAGSKAEPSATHAPPSSKSKLRASNTQLRCRVADFEGMIKAFDAAAGLWHGSITSQAIWTEDKPLTEDNSILGENILVSRISENSKLYYVEWFDGKGEVQRWRVKRLRAGKVQITKKQYHLSTEFRVQRLLERPEADAGGLLKYYGDESTLSASVPPETGGRLPWRRYRDIFQCVKDGLLERNDIKLGTKIMLAHAIAKMDIWPTEVEGK
ncbi:hypothetical protein QFC21_006631 [Naganishia friedmannii]|uniref:Uncharacterized protein n=1 Tax=Naganishia friedmannii TaxID=89922 RepID=A0ACC2V0Q4_9TREE|nr:hypothetical protein QFC21_006631 [Naganishia friedmannii]